MRYARPFFDLQVTFAERVAAVAGVPLSQALLDYTNLYIRFGLGRSFDPANPTWQEYVSGLPRETQGDARAVERRDWTYRCYLARAEAPAGPHVVATFGCFSYALSSDGKVRLHFENADPDGGAPLARAQVSRRMSELTALFGHVKRTVPGPAEVVGSSWLYNIEAYRRLFPRSYIASARVLPNRFRHMPLWGQFLDREGRPRDEMTTPFLTRLARVATVAALADCFPFQVLSPSAPLEDFCRFYGVCA